MEPSWRKRGLGPWIEGSSGGGRGGDPPLGRSGQLLDASWKHLGALAMVWSAMGASWSVRRGLRGALGTSPVPKWAPIWGHFWDNFSGLFLRPPFEHILWPFGHRLGDDLGTVFEGIEAHGTTSRQKVQHAKTIGIP